MLGPCHELDRQRAHLRRCPSGAHASGDAPHGCRMLGVWRTTQKPTRGLVDRMAARKGRDGVTSISFRHEFPWADVPEVGAKILVVANGAPEVAQAVADAVAAEIWALRDGTTSTTLPPEGAMSARPGARSRACRHTMRHSPRCLGRPRRRGANQRGSSFKLFMVSGSWGLRNAAAGARDAHASARDRSNALSAQQAHSQSWRRFARSCEHGLTKTEKETP